MTKFSYSLSAVALALTLAGCGALGPNYERPAQSLPTASIKPQSTHTVASVDWLVWWKSFQDPALNALLDEATANSQDLALAAARIDESRASLALTHSSRFPTVDATVNASRSQVSENAGKLQPGANPRYNVFQPGLSSSFEIDFWGKFQRADEAARARLLSIEANRGTVLASLYANVAQSYFALRSFDAQVALAEQTFTTRKENLRLQTKRFEGGVVGELDVQQAVAEAAGIEATLLQAQQNRRAMEATLAVLIGRNPVAIVQPNIVRGAAIDVLFSRATVPGELPSDILNRRPDLIAAEQQLVAANADIGQAKAAYYPTIKLTASLGFESRQLSELFNPSSLFWNLASGITQPLFRAGSIDAVVAGANARKAQATAQYALAVQGAFKDVHDALNVIASSEALVATANKRIAALREVLRLANLRYTNGYSSYLEVLNAQRDLSQAESAVIDAKRAQLAGVVALYKAVGGGWDARANAK
ncbi:MAG: efflux transporter outer membrane subunit [Casimicrobium sp.]